jgi:hypothetical protein
MRYSDQFAGDYLNDDRTPQSAASKWRGDFQRWYMLKEIGNDVANLR